MAGIDLMPQFEAIIARDLPEVDKLSQSFIFLVSQQIEIAQREIELLKVLNDGEALIKEQIKASTMAHVLELYRFCHLKAMGRTVARHGVADE